VSLFLGGYIINYLLLSDGEVQLAFAEHLKERRKKAKMSREALAKKYSTCFHNKNLGLLYF